MLKHFVAAREDKPGSAWRARFAVGRDETTRWYLGSGRGPAPSPLECRTALRQHMPELVPHYDEVCALVGDDDLAHCMLSHYRPPPVVHGCSQAIWLGDGGPALVRNYDFPLDVVSDRFELTAWLGHRVIAKTQRPWGGCLDGMNEEGLVASMTDGGSGAQGLGFSVILIMRYVLETCSRVDQAIAALSRIPVALSQNVTLLDRTGQFATLFLGPDREPTISRLPACTNHQEVATRRSTELLAGSLDRHANILSALDDPTMTLERLTAKFFEPPLYSRRKSSTTVYTAVYFPTEGRVEYLWPGKHWSQRFDNFVAAEYTHDYGELIP